MPPIVALKLGELADHVGGQIRLRQASRQGRLLGDLVDAPKCSAAIRAASRSMRSAFSR